MAWAINFAAYVGIAVWIGGDAINGHQSSGRYFLSNHGKLTEVSHGVFLYSEIHTYLLWILTILTLASVTRAWLALSLTEAVSSGSRAAAQWQLTTHFLPFRRWWRCADTGQTTATQNRSFRYAIRFIGIANDGTSVVTRWCHRGRPMRRHRNDEEEIVWFPADQRFLRLDHHIAVAGRAAGPMSKLT
jgi:hypothetical protein